MQTLFALDESTMFVKKEPRWKRKLFSSKKELFKFVKKTFNVMKNDVKNFFKKFYQNAETVAVLTFASLGASAVIGELPFLVTLPMWIETPMIVPVISVMLIAGLIKLGELRYTKRLDNNG